METQARAFSFLLFHQKELKTTQKDKILCNESVGKMDKQAEI
jgi:hypothetical protein